MKGKFKATNKSRPCLLCGDTSGKCRHDEEKNLILCWNGVGGGQQRPDWEYRGDTEGGGLWGKYRPPTEFLRSTPQDPCPVCRDTSGKCRHTDSEKPIVLCSNGVGGRSESRDWQYAGDTKGGQWGKYVPPHNSSPGKGFMPPPEMPLKERDQKWRKYLDRLTLNDTDRADLVRRGVSDQEIVRGMYRSVKDGYLIPVFSPSGLILGAQKRLREAPDGGRYRWCDAPGVSNKKVMGQLPITVVGLDRVDPIVPLRVLLGEVKALIIGEAFLKGNIASASLRIPYLGVGAVNQLTSSRGLIKEALEEIAPEVVLFAPDRGCLLNPRVMGPYTESLRDLQQWGYKVFVLWWGQGYSKDFNDIDELTPVDLENLEFLTVDEFLALAVTDACDTYDRDDRLSYWGKAREANKFVHDRAATGDGKSHAAGQQEGRHFYVTADPRNQSTPTFKGWQRLEARHNGLTDRDGKTRRAKTGDVLMTSANCSRVEAHHQARARGIPGEEICRTCPLFHACCNSQGDGYGLRNERMKALIEDRIVSHPQSLPSPDKFDYSQTHLTIEEAGQMPWTESIQADRDDITNLLVDLDDRVPKLTEFLKVLRGLMSGEGMSGTDRWWGIGADKLPKLPELTPEERVIVEEVLTPDFSTLDTEDGIAEDEFNKVKGSKKHQLAQANRALKRETRQSSSEVAAIVGQMPNQGILWWLDGGIPSLHDGTLTITRRNDRFVDILKAAASVIFLDATISTDRLALLLGVDRKDIYACKSDTPETLPQIVKIEDMGRLGMQRGGDQEKRVTALIEHYRSVDPTTKAIDFKKNQGDGAWFRDSRGSNDFVTCNTLVLVGTPAPNVEAIRSEYLALGGAPAKFQAYYNDIIREEIVQGIGRIRANRRQGEALTVVLATDFKIAIPGMQVVKAGDITPGAAPKHERTIAECVEAAKSLIAEGLKATQTAVAKIVGLARETVNRLWESVTFSLESSISKMSHSDPPLGSLEDVAPVVETLKAVLNDNEAGFIDIAEVFSWVDREIWGKIRDCLTDQELEKISSLAIT